MFKKVRVVCFMLVLALCLPIIPTSAVSGVTALSYVMIDAESGQVLFGQNMDDQYDPASITKVMTIGLACEKAQGDWDIPLTVSYEDVASIANTGSSHIALQVGEVISLEDALHAVMMQSANDAANVLAAYVGGDIEGGVAAMNAMVEELGLENTHFDNPHGLTSDTHKVSAADMAEILRWALKQPGFLALFSCNEPYTMEPTNMQEDARYFSLSDYVRIATSKYYVPEVVGSKTGYTDVSRYTYVSLAESDGRSFICVTLHSQEKTDRYNDVALLYAYAFEHFTKVEVAASGETFAVNVYGGNAKLGATTVTASGTSFYLYDGLGAEDITCTYEMDPNYILGAPYQAMAIYTLPQTSKQEAFTVEIPMAISDISTLLEASHNVDLPASAALLPKAKRSMFGIGLALLLLIVGLIAWRVKVRKPKSRYKRLHKYTR